MARTRRTQPGSTVLRDDPRFGPCVSVPLSRSGQCHWHCPYCPARDAGKDECGFTYVAGDTLVVDTACALARLKPGQAKRLLIGGAGEATMHPDFDRIGPVLAELARAFSLDSVLITNGDRCHEPLIAAAIRHFSTLFVKWDPGVKGGAWKRLDDRSAGDRRELLRGFPDLRVQSLIFEGADGAGGNNVDSAIMPWIADLQNLGPREVHLITVPATSGGQLLPAGAATMERWRRLAEQSLGVPVFAWPNS